MGLLGLDFFFFSSLFGWGENKFPQARKPSKNVEVTPAVACSAAMIDQLQGLKSPITEKRFLPQKGDRLSWHGSRRTPF